MDRLITTREPNFLFGNEYYELILVLCLTFHQHLFFVGVLLIVHRLLLGVSEMRLVPPHLGRVHACQDEEEEGGDHDRGAPSVLGVSHAVTGRRGRGI
jgi:hypothetical protein